MNDILGRTISEGNLVIAKGSGRSYYGLRLGVFIGSSVRFKNGSSASYDELFLVENPSPKELEYKNMILEKVNKEKALRKQKKLKEKVKKQFLRKI